MHEASYATSKTLEKSGKHDRSLDHSLLNLHKSFHSSLWPCDFSFLKTIGYRDHDSAELFNKLTVKGGKPIITSDVMDVFGLKSFFDSSNFFQGPQKFLQ